MTSVRKVFRQNRKHHQEATVSTHNLVTELKQCAKRRDLQRGKLLHSVATETGCHHNLYVANTLISMYTKCGDVHKARQLFDQMIEKDVVTWTALMVGYVENGESLKSLELFSCMNCAPDVFTFAAVLKACTAAATGNKLEKKVCLERGAEIHLLATVLGFHKDVVVATALVDMYSKCGDILRARSVFDVMTNRNVVSWTALIHGYVENGQSLVALELFDSMNFTPELVTCIAALKACRNLASGNKMHNTSEMANLLSKARAIHKQAEELGFHRNVVLASTLVDMYSKFGDMVTACTIFDCMNPRDVVAWNVLILGYVDNCENENALDVFNAMDVAPDNVTFVAGLKACAGLACRGNSQVYLKKGIELHQRARELGFDKDVAVGGTLVSMYCKYSDMQKARAVLDEMEKRSVISWTSLLLGYVENGENRQAWDVFSSMDCAPNTLTFAAILKACGSLGDLEAGRKIHAQVCRVGLEQDELVTTSLVDFYGKCGNMKTAESVFSRIHAKETVTWTALVGGYSSLGSTDQVFCLVGRMHESGVQLNGVTMQLILSACSRAGLVQEGQMYFESMSKYGLKPTLEHYGCMVDMLGRANKLEEGLSLVRRMPFEVNSVIWKTLLGACRKWSSTEIGSIAVDALFSLDKDKGTED